MLEIDLKSRNEPGKRQKAMMSDDLTTSSVAPSFDEDPISHGISVSFPYDRMTVEQFRVRFPRSRWSDEHRAWLVPGKTAGRRVRKWLAELEAEADAHADAKGRDAFAFDPIESRYLEIGNLGFRVRTPYSMTVVNELREVPFSRWDRDLRVWHVPFRSYESLRRHWPLIEAAAQRNEPEERRRRAEERKGSDEEKHARLRAAERKRRRYPLALDDLPPLERPVTTSYGIVIFTEITGELVDPEDVRRFYSRVTDDHVWGLWRAPTFEELVRAWPAKTASNAGEWWFPLIEELRPARRVARAKTKRHSA